MVHSEVDIGLSCTTTTLCGDDHHAGGSTVTIEGGRSCVLQHRHAGDVAGVEVRDIAVVDRSINDIQRVVATIDGTNTTNTNLRFRTRLTVGTVDLNARCTSF